MNKIESLVPIEHNNRRVLLTAQLAEMYGTTEKTVSYNYNYNKDRYRESVDFFCLTGEPLRAFKRESGISGIAENLNKLYLWTEHGALLHAKSLGTDEAWATYGKLVDTYFESRGAQKLPQNDPFAQINAEARRMRAEAMALNAKNRAAKMLLSAYSEAGVSAQYKVLALRDVYAPAGINVPLEGVRTEPKTYDATTIAQMLGIYSTSGKAHAQAVSALIETIGVKDGECIRVPCQSLNGHSDSTLQYTGAVVERLREWLQSHNYPTKFAKADGTRNFTVVYEAAS